MQLDYENDSQLSEQDPNEKVVLKSRSELSDRLTIVTGVIEAYLRIREAPPVVCVNLDPQPESRSHKWTPVGAEFCADVESALRRFLVIRPDRITLRQAWETLLQREDYSRITSSERTLVMALAPIFTRNGLSPHLYFRHIRKRGR